MRHPPARLLLAATAALVAACSAHAQTPSGQWQGLALDVRADAPPETYPVRIRVEGEDVRVDYPTLACGGRLDRLGAIGDVVEYRERLTYGLDKCLDGGRVALRPQGGKLLWYWTGAETSEPDVAASAVLGRAPTS